jgi:hypothetical protein
MLGYRIEIMKFDIGTGCTEWLRAILHNIFWAEQAAAATRRRIGYLTRQRLTIVFSALMIMILGRGEAFAQPVPMPGAGQSNPPVTDDSQQVPQAQPLSAEQLDQLVAPIALYPDALLAKVLAAASHPTQVVEADRWRQAQGNASAEQITAGAETQNWDSSVKALTAFPTVLAQMDRNIRWTTDLGNAYYNQAQDLMDSVQAMRQQAQAAVQLHSRSPQVVTNDGGTPATPPGRGVLLQYIDGSVSIQPRGTGNWVAAMSNRPLTLSDNVWTDKASRAELNVGTGMMRMNSETSLTIVNVDRRTVQVRIHQGTLELHVRHLFPGELYEVDSSNGSFTLTKAGDYSFDVDPGADTTTITAWKGEGSVTGEGPAVRVHAHEQVRLSGIAAIQRHKDPKPDGFDEWCRVRDRRQDSDYPRVYPYPYPYPPGVIVYGRPGPWY